MATQAFGGAAQADLSMRFSVRAAPGLAGRASGGAAPADPSMAFRFKVVVGSAHGRRVIGGFSDVTGLTAESDVESLRIGGVNSAETTLPGATKYPSRLVLKRGLGDPAQLWGWYLKVMSGAVIREDVTVTMLLPGGGDGLAWTFSQACPVKWTGPELHAGTSVVAFETVELIHKGFLLPPG